MIEIDEIKYSSLLIVDYMREQEEILLKELIEWNENIIISMYYEKQNTEKTIRDLTYQIGNIGVDLEKIGKSRQDFEIVAFSYKDAQYIRKEMQINNQELYFLSLYITIFSKNGKELQYLLHKLESILISKGMQSRRAYFRQEQAFLATMPLMINKKEIQEVSKRNVLTEGIIGTYPFISSHLWDENGIFIGINLNTNSCIFLDRYDTKKYKNANICVFGTSGAGKSFYIKLIVYRYRLLGIEQYIIDPEREYSFLADIFNGVIVKIGPKATSYINIMDIREESKEESVGYLASKIPKLIGFFQLILGEITEEDRARLEEKIVQTYEKKGITFEDKTLWKNKTQFREEREMPILEDLYHELGKDHKTKNMQILFIPFVKGSLRCFNHHTNIKITNKLIIADVYDLGEENLKYGMYLFTDLFWDNIKKDRNGKKAIYLDEIWRLIGITSNKGVANFIYKIFKTIRKYGGSAIAITQDISDLFGLENGIYGKSIINNASIKNIFSMEEEGITLLEQNMTLEKEEKIQIKGLQRGECLMLIGENHILVKIECLPSEKEKFLRKEET